MIQLKSLLADILNEYSSKKVKPIHENIFKAKGKFKDFLVKLFKKDDSQQIIDEVNKYEEKYGTELGNETFVDSVKLLRKIQTQRNTSTKYEQIFTSIAILTDSPVTFISDDTKKVSRVSYHVMYQRQEGNNIITFYDYFKFLYLIDGQQTDEMSSMKVHKDFTCFTSTLEGKTSGCNLSQEIRDEILKSHEDTPDYETCKTYLDKIQ